MKKIVRLTESDLVRLVKRVIKEQSPLTQGSDGLTGRLATNLVDFGKWAQKKQAQCPPKPKDFSITYCPKGTWKYFIREQKFKFYSDKNELVAEINETPNMEEFNNRTVNELQELASWVIKNNNDSGNFEWSGINQKASRMASVHISDNTNKFIGTLTFSLF